MKITLEVELTNATCGDIAITAAEGGIGYWSQIEKYDYQRWSPESLRDAYVKGEAPATNIEVADDFVFYTIKEIGDWGVPIETHEDGTPCRHDITPEVIGRGVQAFIGGVPTKGRGIAFKGRPFADMEDLAAMDSDEADAVIQLGLFGELVYG